MFAIEATPEKLITLDRRGRRIRALQARLQAEHPDYRCYYGGTCMHPVPRPDIPRDVYPVVVQTLINGVYSVTVLLITLKTRELGGYYVIRSDNERMLGWTCRLRECDENAGTWAAYVSSCAFRGDGPDDMGDILDHVPKRLYNGNLMNDFTSEAVNHADARLEAAYDIVYYLVRRQAPAIGFGRHPHVGR